MFKLTPLLRQLKKLCSSTSIDVVCEERQAEILADNENVSRIFSIPSRITRRQIVSLGYDLRLQHYDLVIDCRSDSISRHLTRMTGAARTHGFSNKKSKLFSRAAYTHHLPRDPQESDLKANLKLLQIGDVNIDDDKIDFPPRNVLNLDLHRKLKLAQDRPIAIISIAERDFEAGSQFEALDCWSADQAGRIYNLLAEKCLSINCVPLLMYNTPSQLFAADVLSYSKSNKWLDFCTDSLQEVRELIQHGSIVISESELDGCIANATGTPFVRWPQSNEGYEVNEEMLLSFWPCITTLVSRKKDFSRYNSPNNRNAA